MLHVGIAGVLPRCELGDPEYDLQREVCTQPVVVVERYRPLR